MWRATESIIASFNGGEPLVRIGIIASNDVDIFAVDVNSSVPHSANVQLTVQLECIHALVHLIDLIARSVTSISTNDQESSGLLGVHQSRVLSELVIFNVYLSAGALERLIVVNSFILDLN